jgi:DNA-binding CsgD family transcriptional regulator
MVAEQAGDPIAVLDQLSATLDEQDLTGPRHLWLPQLVRLALAEGDQDLARRAVDTAVQDARAESQGRRATAARWCAALLAGDVAALDACVDWYRTCQWLPYLANVGEDAAVAAAAAGDTDGARHRLTSAADIYAELGAEWELSRADARLRAYGVRRGHRPGPARPSTGWQSLTKTERRVAELVAQGRSNPDIAALLFLSRRTVQTHVSHILAKLDLKSRVDVAREAVWHLPCSDTHTSPD